MLKSWYYESDSREVVQRLSEEVPDNIVWYTRFYLVKNIVETD